MDKFSPGLEGTDIHEAHAVMDHRELSGDGGTKVEHLIKWKGYNKKSDQTWEPEEHLTDYGSAELLNKYKRKQGLLVYSTTTFVDDTFRAVVKLMGRHELSGSVDAWMKAYDAEYNAVASSRLTELFGEDYVRVMKEERAIATRMNPEPKKDGRCKMRWLVMGHLEPESWTQHMRMDSPTTVGSTVKMLIALADTGAEEEHISIGDISTAFLKSDLYIRKTNRRDMSNTHRTKWLKQECSS